MLYGLICDAIAGMLSGMLAFSIGHPLDTIKVHQQVRGITALKATKEMFKRQGVRGFYRGMSLPLLTQGFLGSVFFGVYGPLLDLFVERRAHRHIALLEDVKNVETPEATYAEIFVAGCLAGGVQVIFTSPIELVKIKLQMQGSKKAFSGPIHCIRTVISETGFRGLYKGLGPLICRDVFPGSGLWVVSYEFLRRELRNDAFNLPHLAAHIIAGGTAGVISWIFVIPFDVVKSRMQADNHLNPIYKSMTHCVTKTFREKGLPELFRGFWSACGRAFPVNAIGLVTYQAFADECKIITILKNFKEKRSKED